MMNEILTALLVATELAPPAADVAGDASGTLRKRAEDGDVEAQRNLGLSLLWRLAPGRAVPESNWRVKMVPGEDPAQAVEWLRRAAMGGDAEAQYTLGTLHDVGIATGREPSKALEWYEKAAAQGHAKAEYRLGAMHDFGRGVPRDSARALSWYERAAAKGLREAQNNLAAMYGRGRGVPRDDGKAAGLYRKAADQGYPPAQLNLGIFLIRGLGVPLDVQAGVQMIRRAAEEDYPEAWGALGALYADGTGVSQNDVLAYAWLSLAASRAKSGALMKNEQRSNAELALQRLAERMKPEEVARARKVAAELSVKLSGARAGTPAAGPIWTRE